MSLEPGPTVQSVGPSVMTYRVQLKSYTKLCFSSMILGLRALCENLNKNVTSSVEYGTPTSCSTWDHIVILSPDCRSS